MEGELKILRMSFSVIRSSGGSEPTTTVTTALLALRPLLLLLRLLPRSRLLPLKAAWCR